MKYTVKCSCGHEINVVLFGPNKDREVKIKWYESQGLCPECYRAKVAEEANKTSSENSLPALNGTPKQVAWAEEIRARRVNELNDMAGKAIARCEWDIQAHPENAEILQKELNKTKAEKERTLSWIRSKTEAKFWIDTRYCIGFFNAHRSEIAEE